MYSLNIQLQHQKTEAPKEDLSGKLAALCSLSNVKDQLSVLEKISEAPDPETAMDDILKAVGLDSPALIKQWQSVIPKLWANQHPKLPWLPQMKIRSDEVVASPILKDAWAFVDSLEQQPAKMIPARGETLLDSSDAERIARTMPSLKGGVGLAESEWGYEPMRRLRLVLETGRLVRRVKGELVPVASRWGAFRELPVMHQLYALWHIDTHHVAWAPFARFWAEWVDVMQEFSPWLWDMHQEVKPAQTYNRLEWATRIQEEMLPAWEDAGLNVATSGWEVALSLSQQQGLPAVIDKMITRDLFVRHGLAMLGTAIDGPASFTWTKQAPALLQAETGLEGPCVLDWLRTL